MKCRTIEHTADIGIEVEAEDLPTLFAGAASCMFGLVVDTGTVRPEESVDVRLEGADLQELLFKWLNELIYILDARSLLLSRFAVERIGEDGLEATVLGERVDPGRHEIREEIKAATYHEMVVENRGDRWFARVILDV